MIVSERGLLDPAPMTADLAYLAGLLDGEGTITLERSSNPRAFRAPLVSISSTDRELVDAALSIAGAGWVQTKKRAAQAHWKQGYEYRVKNAAAIELLGKLRPYLRCPAKVHRADMLLHEYGELTKRNGRYSEQERQAKLDFETRFLAGKNPLFVGEPSAM